LLKKANRPAVGSATGGTAGDFLISSQSPARGFDLDLAVLYRLAALPEKIVAMDQGLSPKIA
jgi:hypothetical protein